MKEDMREDDNYDELEELGKLKDNRYLPVDMNKLEEEFELAKTDNDRISELKITKKDFPYTYDLSIQKLAIKTNDVIEKDTNGNDVHKKEPIPLLAWDLGEQINDNRRLPIAKTANNILYYYRSGVYIPNGEEAIKEVIIQLLQAADLMHTWNAELVGSTIQYISTKCTLLPEIPPFDFILNFKNCMYDFKSKKTREHSPEYLTTIQFPIDYDPVAECFGIDTFMHGIFLGDSEAIRVGWEILAWALSPVNKTQKMLLLTGDGNNGKSTFLNLIQNLVGHNNSSTTPLHELSTKFATSSLYQKQVNVCADISTDKLTDTHMMKLIAGNNDRVDIEFKGKKKFSTKLFCKLIFSAYETPRSTDNSEGFYRRFCIVPFDARFDLTDSKVAKIATMVDEAICDPRELSGALNKIIEVMPEILRSGINETESMKEALLSFRKNTDPLAEWLDETVEEYTGIGDSRISKLELYQLYEKDCRGKRVIPKNIKAFGRVVNKLLPYATTVFMGSSKAWGNIHLKSDT